MCCCGTPNINGQLGYRWQPNDNPSVRPIDPPALSDGETLVRDEPGRCGGLDSHCHHYRIASRGGSYYLLVRNGGGDKRIRLFKPEAEALRSLDSTPCYWIMGAIYHAESEGRRDGQQSTESKWRRAAFWPERKINCPRSKCGIRIGTVAAFSKAISLLIGTLRP